MEKKSWRRGIWQRSGSEWTPDLPQQAQAPAGEPGEGACVVWQLRHNHLVAGRTTHLDRAVIKGDGLLHVDRLHGNWWGEQNTPANQETRETSVTCEPRGAGSRQISAHPCSGQHCSQEPRGRSDPNVHPWMTGCTKCGPFIQWNITQP